MPSANVSLPSGVTGTFMKKFTLLDRSRLLKSLPYFEPQRDSASRKLSRQLCM